MGKKLVEIDVDWSDDLPENSPKWNENMAIYMYYDTANEVSLYIGKAITKTVGERDFEHQDEDTVKVEVEELSNYSYAVKVGYPFYHDTEESVEDADLIWEVERSLIYTEKQHGSCEVNRTNYQSISFSWPGTLRIFNQGNRVPLPRKCEVSVQ